MFEYEINSGISEEELRLYFMDAALSYKETERIFYGDGWEVRLLALPDAIHRSIIIPRTLIRFRGEKVKCESLIFFFRKAFMRGGA